MGSFQALMQQCQLNVQKRYVPYTPEAWWLLKARWERYDDRMRAVVLREAQISEDKPLEQYTNPEKRAIANAVAYLVSFAELDKSLTLKARREQRMLAQGDE